MTASGTLAPALLLGCAVCAPGAASAQVGPGALASCLERGFSTEEDFVTQGPTPPDGNPIVSDGDLFASGCAICARNADLLAPFGVSADLGLDAADVVPGDPPIAVFSTELDGPPETFTAGDLLATNGAAIPNVALTAPFGVDRDIGLDALHLVGDPDDLVAFLGDAANVARGEWLAAPGVLAELLGVHDVDLWFSTEGAHGTSAAPLFLDGDVLSATGFVVRSQPQLLPSSVPAGIPTRGVDFGLDALGADRAGSVPRIWFSTEIGHPDEDVGFGHADLLVHQGGVDTPGAAVYGCFEPKSLDLGVDAVVPEPGGLALLVCGGAALLVMGRRRAVP